MSYQPPCSLLQPHHKNFLLLIQMTDLHLPKYPHTELAGVNCDRLLDAILDKIQQEYPNADLLVATGDLVHDITKETYDRIFNKVASLNMPFIGIAGNHDVTQELDQELPFPQRRHVAKLADKRLATRHRIETPFWNLLFLDSSVPGKVFGRFSQETLDWLVNELENSSKPCVAFAHHPMLPVNSAWIDNHMLQNSEQFWQAVTPFNHKLKAILVGHIHQEQHLIFQHIHLLSSPATSMQFVPYQQDFAIDSQNMAGFRWLTLYNNGNLATGVKRIDTIRPF